MKLYQHTSSGSYILHLYSNRFLLLKAPYISATYIMSIPLDSPHGYHDFSGKFVKRGINGFREIQKDMQLIRKIYACRPVNSFKDKTKANISGRFSKYC